MRRLSIPIRGGLGTDEPLCELLQVVTQAAIEGQAGGRVRAARYERMLARRTQHNEHRARRLEAAAGELALQSPDDALGPPVGPEATPASELTCLAVT